MNPDYLMHDIKVGSSNCAVVYKITNGIIYIKEVINTDWNFRLRSTFLDFEALADDLAPIVREKHA